MGRVNRKPRRWYFSPWVIRTNLALRLRTDWLENASAGRGATGISNERPADFGKLRRVARSIPPALILRAVANSRNSFPFSSTPLTKTGMDSGSRWCLLRSAAFLAAVDIVPASPAHTDGQTFRLRLLQHGDLLTFPISYVYADLSHTATANIVLNLLGKFGNFLRCMGTSLQFILTHLLTFHNIHLQANLQHGFCILPPSENVSWHV